MAAESIGVGGRVVVAVVGPTGSGKSALAVSLAQSFDGEVVSCDALQVYRGLDIGTGKIGVTDRAGIPHHLLDIVGPDHEFSAADYIRTVAPLVRDIVERGKLPIVVGGTGLYLRSLVRGLFEGPGRTPVIRARIADIAERRGPAHLHRMLNRLDPVAACRIHPNDVVRVTRALEVLLVSRNTMSDMMSRRRSPLEGYRFVLLGLSPPRSELVKRIERRVEEMFRAGFVGEVRRLLSDHGSDVPAFKAIGYREVARYLNGEMTLADAKRATIRATVRYAKRQMTWFRREEGVVWRGGWGDEPGLQRQARDYLMATLVKRRPEGKEALYAETAP